MKLLLDQGLPRPAAALLRDSGIDCVHVGELKMAAAPDPAIMAYAAEHGRVIVTLDSDFHTLLYRFQLIEPSVIRVRMEGLREVEAAATILRVLDHVGDTLLNGCAVTVTTRSIRTHLLPIRSTPIP